MQKRKHSREFKLNVVRLVESGQKQISQVCSEYDLAERLLYQWRREYRERGKDAFLPRTQEESMTPEELERKRAWDRDYYQAHKSERKAAVHARKTKFAEYIQEIKAGAGCAICGENHPATLQFHHRDPSQKEFSVGEFATRQLGNMERLKKEIEKCDILCANCHLKYLYNQNYKTRRARPEGFEPPTSDSEDRCSIH